MADDDKPIKGLARRLHFRVRLGPGRRLNLSFVAVRFLKKICSKEDLQTQTWQPKHPVPHFQPTTGLATVTDTPLKLETRAQSVIVLMHREEHQTHLRLSGDTGTPFSHLMQMNAMGLIFFSKCINERNYVLAGICVIIGLYKPFPSLRMHH